MAESDVFAKLSRILETHAFDEGSDLELEDLLHSNAGTASPSESYQNHQQNLQFSSSKPTPFEVWRSKQKNVGKSNESRKLNPQEWDRLVDRMHQTNRMKQSAMVKEQNQGFALELGGHEFKPKMNRTSMDLAATMKSLSVRMPEMETEREKFLAVRRNEREKDEMKECSFAPSITAKLTERYVNRMGRRPLVVDDLLRFKEEKLRRQEQRRQIVEEYEAKELTFKPQLNIRSQQIQEKLKNSRVLQKDPTTNVTISKPRRAELEAADLEYEGAPLILDSDHPYKHNTNEYIAVAIPGAIRYTITFSPKTSTEAIHDYVKFYRDDTCTDHWGSGKYSGGAQGSAANWPGSGGRPALVIPSTKFVVHFRTNGSVNDWGFRMLVTPIMTSAENAGISSYFNGNNSASASPRAEYQPEITPVGKSYKGKQTGEDIHSRLYREGLEKKINEINFQAELLQAKTNLPLRPWEAPRGGLDAQTSWTESKTHLVKPANAPIIEEMIVDDHEDMPVSVLEYDYDLSFLWRSLRGCMPQPDPTQGFYGNVGGSAEEGGELDDQYYDGADL